MFCFYFVIHDQSITNKKTINSQTAKRCFGFCGRVFPMPCSNNIPQASLWSNSKIISIAIPFYFFVIFIYYLRHSNRNKLAQHSVVIMFSHFFVIIFFLFHLVYLHSSKIVLFIICNCLVAGLSPIFNAIIIIVAVEMMCKTRGCRLA